MHAAIDVPTPTIPLDPHRFAVRGWVALGDQHSQLNNVELWSGSAFLGRSEGLNIRPDVNQALGLLPTDRVGFDFLAHFPAHPRRALIKFDLRLRFRDGSLTNPILASAAPIMDLSMPDDCAARRPIDATHLARTARWLRRFGTGKDFGVEIGAFKTPIPGINPLYLDRFPAYGYEDVKADYFADALALPIKDNSLDYVANCNVFEHLANPVKALWEWVRVLRDGGIMYLVIPDRRLTFDRNRSLTAPEHIMADFEADTNDVDPTHVTEYIDGVDWSLWAPEATQTERLETREKLRAAYTAAVAAGEPINIHFHTFELGSFVRLLALMNAHPSAPAVLQLVDASEYFPSSHPSGFLAVIRVRKSAASRIHGAISRIRARRDVRSVLCAGAKSFDVFAQSQILAGQQVKGSERALERD